MSSERREHVRQKVSRVEVRVATRESLRASYLRDLSMGGLFVRSRQPLPEGTPVVIELSVEAESPLRLRGEVVRQERLPDGTARGFGVRFSMVDLETTQALESILAAHREPETDGPAVGTQLAEARGTIEALEEAMALLREREMELAQRLETADAERGVLMSVAHELQGRVQHLEAERTSLRANVEALLGRLAKGEGEASSLRETSARITAELMVARTTASKTVSEHQAIVGRIAAELEVESERSAALQRAFEGEVEALRAQLEAKDEGALRGELQDLSAQLDDERLKSMALERALQRFVAMGGMIPPRID